MPIDWLAYHKNRSAVPLEELERYAGKHVAWSNDGSRIIASAESDEQIWVQLDAEGVPSDDYVLGYVPMPDEVWFGPLTFHREDPAASTEPK